MVKFSDSSYRILNEYFEILAAPRTGTENSFIQGQRKTIFARGGLNTTLYQKNENGDFIPHKFLIQEIDSDNFKFQYIGSQATHNLATDLEMGQEMYFRKDSLFHDWLKVHATEYEQSLNTNKTFIYFGKIYAITGEATNYNIIFEGMKNFVEYALPENNRTEKVVELLKIFFDNVYQDIYNMTKTLWSFFDAREVDIDHLYYLADRANVIIDKDKISPELLLREFIDMLPWWLKRKGTYSSYLSLYKILLGNTKNKLNFYERWTEWCLKYLRENEGLIYETDFQDHHYLEFYGRTPSGGAGPFYYDLFNPNNYPSYTDTAPNEDSCLENSVFCNRPVTFDTFGGEDEGSNLTAVGYNMQIDGFNPAGGVKMYLYRTPPVSSADIRNCLTVSIDSTAQPSGGIFIWAVSDHANKTLDEHETDNENYLGISFELDGTPSGAVTGRRFTLWDSYNGSNITRSSSASYSADTEYYLSIEKIADELTLKVYNDVRRRNQFMIEKIRLPLSENKAYNTLYIPNYRAGAGGDWTGDIQNFYAESGDSSTIAPTGNLILSPHYRVEIDLSSEPMGDDFIISQNQATELLRYWTYLKPVSKFVHYNWLLSPIGQIDIYSKSIPLYDVRDTAFCNTQFFGQNYVSGSLPSGTFGPDADYYQNLYVEHFLISQNPWIIRHNLDTQELIIQTYDKDNYQIWPINHNFASVNRVEIDWSTAERGTVFVAELKNWNYSHLQTQSSSAWNIDHNLGTSGASGIVFEIVSVSGAGGTIDLTRSTTQDSHFDIGPDANWVRYFGPSAWTVSGGLTYDAENKIYEATSIDSKYFGVLEAPSATWAGYRSGRIRVTFNVTGESKDGYYRSPSAATMQWTLNGEPISTSVLTGISFELLESFEGSYLGPKSTGDGHYDNPNWASAGSFYTGTLDPEYSSGESGWGTESLRVVNPAAALGYNYIELDNGGRSFSGKLKQCYVREEVIVESNSLSTDGGAKSCLQLTGWDTAAQLLRLHIHYSVSDGTFWKLQLGNTPDWAFYKYRTPISLGTKYRHEILWDSIGNTVDWKINGTVVSAGLPIPTTYQGQAVGNLIVGSIQGNPLGPHEAVTWVIDNIGVTSAGWPGTTYEDATEYTVERAWNKIAESGYPAISENVRYTENTVDWWYDNPGDVHNLRFEFIPGGTFTVPISSVSASYFSYNLDVVSGSEFTNPENLVDGDKTTFATLASADGEIRTNRYSWTSGSPSAFASYYTDVQVRVYGGYSEPSKGWWDQKHYRGSTALSLQNLTGHGKRPLVGLIPWYSPSISGDMIDLSEHGWQKSGYPAAWSMTSGGLNYPAQWTDYYVPYWGDAATDPTHSGFGTPQTFDTQIADGAGTRTKQNAPDNNTAAHQWGYPYVIYDNGKTVHIATAPSPWYVWAFTDARAQAGEKIYFEMSFPEFPGHGGGCGPPNIVGICGDNERYGFYGGGAKNKKNAIGTSRISSSYKYCGQFGWGFSEGGTSYYRGNRGARNPNFTNNDRVMFALDLTNMTEDGSGVGKVYFGVVGSGWGAGIYAGHPDDPGTIAPFSNVSGANIYGCVCWLGPAGTHAVAKLHLLESEWISAAPDGYSQFSNLIADNRSGNTSNKWTDWISVTPSTGESGIWTEDQFKNLNFGINYLNEWDAGVNDSVSASMIEVRATRIDYNLLSYPVTAHYDISNVEFYESSPSASIVTFDTMPRKAESYLKLNKRAIKNEFEYWFDFQITSAGPGIENQGGEVSLLTISDVEVNDLKDLTRLPSASYAISMRAASLSGDMYIRLGEHCPSASAFTDWNIGQTSYGNSYSTEHLFVKINRRSAWGESSLPALTVEYYPTEKRLSSSMIYRQVHYLNYTGSFYANDYMYVLQSAGIIPSATDRYNYSPSGIFNTYYTNYDAAEPYWETNPGQMVDGDLTTYAQEDSSNGSQIVDTLNSSYNTPYRRDLEQVYIRAHGIAGNPPISWDLSPLFGESDTQEVSGYFNDYDTGTAWNSNPANMVDGDRATAAVAQGFVTSPQSEMCTSNTATDNGYNISKIELRAYGAAGGTPTALYLIPWINGNFGDNYDLVAANFPTNGNPGGWSDWMDITNDGQGPPAGNGAGRPWNFDDIAALDVEAYFERNVADGPGDTVYITKIEINVSTYTAKVSGDRYRLKDYHMQLSDQTIATSAGLDRAFVYGLKPGKPMRKLADGITNRDRPGWDNPYFSCFDEYGNFWTGARANKLFPVGLGQNPGIFHKNEGASSWTRQRFEPSAAVYGGGILNDSYELFNTWYPAGIFWNSTNQRIGHCYYQSSGTPTVRVIEYSLGNGNYPNQLTVEKDLLLTGTTWAAFETPNCIEYDSNTDSYIIGTYQGAGNPWYSFDATTGALRVKKSAKKLSGAYGVAVSGGIVILYESQSASQPWLLAVEGDTLSGTDQISPSAINFTWRGVGFGYGDLAINPLNGQIYSGFSTGTLWHGHQKWTRNQLLTNTHLGYSDLINITNDSAAPAVWTDADVNSISIKNIFQNNSDAASYDFARTTQIELLVQYSPSGTPPPASGSTTITGFSENWQEVYGDNPSIIFPKSAKIVSPNTLKLTFNEEIDGKCYIRDDDYYHQQTTASEVWTIKHNLGIDGAIVMCYDSNGLWIMPERIELVDSNITEITFNEAVAGTAVFVIFQGTFLPGNYIDSFVNGQGYWKAGDGGAEVGFNPLSKNDINNVLTSGGLDDFSVTSSAASGYVLINFTVPKAGSYEFNEFGIFDTNKNLHYYTKCSDLYKPDGVSLNMRYRISKTPIA